MADTLVIRDCVTRIEERQYINGTFETVVFAPSVEEIGKEAFIGCDQVKVFVLPDGIKRIDKRAFEGTKAAIYIPKSIQYVGEEAFDYDVEAYFECGEKDFEGYEESFYVENDHPFAFYGYGGGGGWQTLHYYRNADKVHFNEPRERFLERFKDLLD